MVVRQAVANDVYQDATVGPSPTVLASTGGRATSTLAGEHLHWIEAETDISRYAIGREWDTLAPGGQSTKYFSLQRAPLETPCPTIQCPPNAAWSPTAPSSSASVCHPTEKRKFSIAELKRICAFPDDFILTGTYAQQWERMGRAVPPVMMRHIAAAIRDEVLPRCAE